MPKVSVIIPTYNRAGLLKRAIQSVLNQIYQDFEIIIVDDASTDNTENVIESFKEHRIRYIKHESNKGAAVARNTGIKFANENYIAFQDSDDEWLPGKLEKQMEIIEHASPRVGVVYTGYRRIIGNKETYFPPSWVNKRENDIHKELLKNRFIGIPTALIRRECFEKSGLFDERLPQLEDWEMWLRISKFYEFKCIDEPLVIAYYTQHSVSTKQETLIEALKMILEKHYEEFAKNKRLLAEYEYWIGSLLCQIGEVPQGRGYLGKSMKLDPLNIKYFIAALVSLFGKGSYNKVVRLKRRI
jgi:glycosyltransferase involved in cell wall biosynthesis